MGLAPTRGGRPLTVLESTAPDDVGREQGPVAPGRIPAGRRRDIGTATGPRAQDTWALDLDAIIADLEATLRPTADLGDHPGAPAGGDRGSPSNRQDGRVPPIDDATRPRRARGLGLTVHRRAPGLRLRAILHDVFRGDLRARIAQVKDVARGRDPHADLRAAVSHLAGGSAKETLGGLCGGSTASSTRTTRSRTRRCFPRSPDCRLCTGRRAAGRGRLVIHAHLLRIDAVLLRLGDDAGAFAELTTPSPQWQRTCFSPLHLQEQELAEPLGLLGVPI